jgi:predicted nucleotidyltransferase
MRSRSFKLGEETVTLPRGTRVLLKTELRGEDGFLHRSSTPATVRDVFHNTYLLETASGRRLRAERDQIRMAREELLADLGTRQWDFRRLRESVQYEAVVGSRAWGLADEASDEDVRGWFLLPFDDLVGLWDHPDEIQDPETDAAYWEIEKLLYQALRADANTLECLWSPFKKEITPLGEKLLGIRHAFLSMNVLGSFGRYAESQFQKIERAELRNRAIAELLEAIESQGLSDAESAASFLRKRGVAATLGRAKDEVKAVYRSLFDRGLLPEATFQALLGAVADGRRKSLEPPPHRPKNAYNLLRLLHSCLHCLRAGEPLIRVEGELRDTLLAVKKREVPIEDVLERARDLAKEIDAEARESRLPEKPDYGAADEFLKLCRRESAKASFALEIAPPAPLTASYGREELHPTRFPVSLPPDVHPDAVGRFLTARVDLSLLWLALSGAHAYGFPSEDSDLDLKGVHVVPSRVLLGLGSEPEAVDVLCDWEEREYDFTSNEVGHVARLLLRGNGNMFERFLGPFPVVTTPAGHRLRELARGALSRRVSHHYGGFLRGMLREYRAEAAAGVRKAKRLLYAYRVALTGIHLLRKGDLVTDVLELHEEYDCPAVRDLVRVKRSRETGTIAEADEPRYLEDLLRLERVLEEARITSVLPEEPRNGEEIESLVIGLRLLL